MDKPNDTNELDPRLLNICSVNPFHAYTSASRVVMFTGHLAQSPIISGSEQRKILSGREAEYGKYTFKHEMPHDAIIIAIIKKYPMNFGIDSIKANPETIVIYEVSGSGREVEYDAIVLEQHSINHQFFGFEFKATPGINLLREGAKIEKGSVFLQSPNIDSDEGYKFGINARVVYETHPAVAEDGFMVRRKFLDRLEFTTYETRVFGYGSNTFAVGAYTEDDIFKAFPAIGSKVGSDGVVVSLRDMIKATAAGDQSLAAASEVDKFFDEIYYAPPDGEVVNVTVINKEKIDEAHQHLSQEDNYSKYYSDYNKKILAAYDKLCRSYKARHNREPMVGNTLHRIATQAKMVVESQNPQQKIKLSRRKEMLDQFHVEVTIKYTHTPNIGGKLTGFSGDKGVICQIVDDEYMPKDKHGVIADIIMEPSISRMNLGRYYEPYLNSASETVHRNICSILNVKIYDRVKLTYNQQAEQAWNLLNEFLQCVNPLSAMWEESNDSIVLNLEHIVKHGITLWIPTNNPRRLRDVVEDIRKDIRFRPDVGPVSFLSPKGKLVTTKNDINIGYVYIMMLQQIGHNWSATSSGRTQVHGLLASTSRETKHRTPHNNQGTRCFGESEMRIISSYGLDGVAARLHDMNNNPLMHKTICENILTSNNPTNLIDITSGYNEDICGNVPVNMSRHYLQCLGIKLLYSPYQSNILSTSVKFDELNLDPS